MFTKKKKNQSNKTQGILIIVGMVPEEKSAFCNAKEKSLILVFQTCLVGGFLFYVFKTNNMKTIFKKLKLKIEN